MNLAGCQRVRRERAVSSCEGQLASVLPLPNASTRREYTEYTQRLHTNQTFPFSGFPRSALKSVTTSKTVRASDRVGLLPGLLFLEGDAADRHAADVRLDMSRRAFSAGAAAAASEIIEQAHERLICPGLVVSQK